MSLAVSYTQPEWRRRSGKYFIGRQNYRNQSLDIGHSGQSGHTHEGQKSGDHQKQQVVAGIDSRETEQKGQCNVERTGLADFQTKGNGMRSMIVRSTPPLSDMDISLRMTSRWAQTAMTVLRTSSGAT